MVAFLLRMGAGINGTPNRAHTNDTEAQYLLPPGPTFYGCGLVMDATGKVRPPVAGDPPATGPNAGGVVYGLYVRPYVTNSNQAALGVDSPPQGTLLEPASVMIRGYMSVDPARRRGGREGRPGVLLESSASGRTGNRRYHRRRHHAGLGDGGARLLHGTRRRQRHHGNLLLRDLVYTGVYTPNPHNRISLKGNPMPLDSSERLGWHWPQQRCWRRRQSSRRHVYLRTRRSTIRPARS